MWVDVARGSGFRVSGILESLVDEVFRAGEQSPLAILEGLPDRERATADAILARLWHARYIEWSEHPSDTRRSVPFGRIEIDGGVERPLVPDELGSPISRTAVVLRAPTLADGLRWTAAATSQLPLGQFRKWTLWVEDVDCTDSEAETISRMDIGVRFPWPPHGGGTQGLRLLREACVDLCAVATPADCQDWIEFAGSLLDRGVSGLIMSLPDSWTDRERQEAMIGCSSVLPNTTLLETGDELVATGWEPRTGRINTPVSSNEVARLLDSAGALEDGCRSPQTPELHEHLYSAEFARETADALGRLASGHVLDLCGGQGPLALRLSQVFSDSVRITVCDRDPFALALGGAHAAEMGARSISFRRCRAEATPFIDGSVDAIVMSGAFDFFLAYKTVPNLLAEVRRILSEEGRFVVLHPLRWVYPGRGDDGPPSPKEDHPFSAALAGGGFRVREVRLLRSFVDTGGRATSTLREQAAQPHLRLRPNYLLFSHPLSTAHWIGGPPVPNSTAVTDTVEEERYLSFGLWLAIPDG